MTEPTQDIVDLTRDLVAVATLSTSPEAVNTLLGEALEGLGQVIPFDLATIMDLEGGELRVRVARGPLEAPEVMTHRLSLDRFPTLTEVLVRGRARAFEEHDHRDGDGDAFDGVLNLPHGHSCMVVPLRSEDEVLGLMTLDRSICGPYSDGHIELAEVLGQLLAMAITYGEQSVLLSRLREQLEGQNRVLRERVEGELDARAMVQACQSPAMQSVVELARQVAPTDTPVLVTGETGTGKEVLARAIHGWSRRAGSPLVTINCAALPAGLIESELFGHVKGAFTGATGTRVGRFQAANGGTLFLDEVGEIPVELQPKLLRVLQEGCFEPVGSDRTMRVDVQLIAATNVDLMAACQEHTFREDLYYRLAVFPIQIPPLRARQEDVAVIARSYLESLARRTGGPGWQLGSEELTELQARPWRGNVRELTNTLERATILGSGQRLALDDGDVLPLDRAQVDRREVPEGPFPTLADMERRHIEQALRRTDAQVHGVGGAAELLGLPPSTLQSRMRRLGLGGARDYRRRLEGD